MKSTLTTTEVVDRLRRLGLHATAAALRADVHRGLVAPGMPGADLPGRGTPARWTPAAVRRLEYVARLRRRGVNGRVLPLLAFIRDGWGWEHIRADIQSAVTRGVELDRRALRRLGRARTRDELLLNLDTGAPAGTALDYRRELLPARQALVTGAVSGAPAEGLSFVPFALALRRLQPGGPPAASEEEAIRRDTENLQERRRAAPLAAAGVPKWLETVTAADVARGRRALHAWLAAFRLVLRTGKTGGSNPMLFGEPSAQALATRLRAETGRLTPAGLLAVAIAQAMVHAKYVSDDEIPDPAEMRSALAPLFAASSPAAHQNA